MGAYALTYQELLTLKWSYGEFKYPLKPGYDKDPYSGSVDYFGTDQNCMTTISVNVNYANTTHVTIKKDGGTRTVYHGAVDTLQDVQWLLDHIQ